METKLFGISEEKHTTIFTSDLKNHIGEEVDIFGWIHVRRDQGKMIFLDFRDMTGKVQGVILPSYVEWSLALVTNDINSLSSRFEAGEVGKHTGEIKQVKEVIRMINDYHKKDWDYIKKYSKSEKMYKAGVIPLTYFSSRLSGLNTFNDGRVKASVAINQTLQTLCDRDSIREVPKPQLAKDFGTSQKCYIIHDMDLLL